MFLIFDILFLITTVFFHTISLFLTYSLLSPAWPTDTFQQCFAIAVAYFLFLHILTISVALARFILQPRMKAGEHPIGLNKGYLSFVLNNLFYNVIVSSPFKKQILFIFYLRWIFYRLFGMKLPFSSIVSFEADIAQPELIEVGKKSIIGAGSILICHYAPNAKTHVQEKIKIGTGSVIGGYSGIAPGFEIGDNSVLGAKSNVYPGVKIGNGVRTGGECTFFFGAQVPDNVKIKSHSFIDKNCQMKSGETWGGNPAKKLS